jgi:hypothetical protein
MLSRHQRKLIEDALGRQLYDEDLVERDSFASLSDVQVKNARLLRRADQPVLCILYLLECAPSETMTNGHRWIADDWLKADRLDP